MTHCTMRVRSKLSKIRDMRAFLFFLLLVLITVLLPLTTVSAAGDVDEQKAQSVKIQEALLNRKYAEAKSLTDALTLDPDASPLPSLIDMTIVQLKMFENFTFNRDAEFLRHSDRNVAVCETNLAARNADTWSLLVCGASDAMRAFHYVKNRQTFKALGFANKAQASFQEVRKREPDNVDVDLGFAMYDYFKSEFTETALAFVPFLKDKRDEALARIKVVSERGTLAKHLADLALAVIALESERQDVAEKVFPKLLAKFPGSVLFPVMDAAFLIKISRYADARALLDAVEKRAPEITVVKYFRGRSLVLEGKDFATAKSELNAYIATKGDASVKGPAYYLLGRIAEREGDTKDALTLYKTAYDTYPRYKASLKALLRLRNAKG